MRYAIARYKQRKRDVAYRIYVADCLRTISENTARFAGGSYITQKITSVLGYEREDQRTGEEIAADVIKQAGLVVLE